VAAVRERIAAAAGRAGRDPQDIVLVAAAKSRSVDEVVEAVVAGVSSIGPNYVQEAAAMRPQVDAAATWRLIGPLQRNKVNQALRVCDTVDSVHSPELAQAIGQRAERARRIVEVLLQVRLGDEDTKSGAAPEDVPRLLESVQLMPWLRCLGLMTIPPPAEIVVTRKWFAALREMADELRAASDLSLPILSMGMSHDFEAAIEEGATHVRVGTALFGPR
jgi:pyridoxal phosphate enzyme (YggS family)